MTAAAPPHPTTSTRRKRSKPRLVGHPPLRAVHTLWCDRCDRLAPVRLLDWLCEPCRRGGAR